MDCEEEAADHFAARRTPMANLEQATVPPRRSTFAESEWRALARFWHPVAFSSSVRARPVGARLLDESLVVFRTSAGVTVARDLCLHRGARLSLGHLDGGHPRLRIPWLSLRRFGSVHAHSGPSGHLDPLEALPSDLSGGRALRPGLDLPGGRGGGAAAGMARARERRLRADPDGAGGLECLGRPAHREF